MMIFHLPCWIPLVRLECDYEKINPYQIDQDINHNVENTLELEFKKIEFEFDDLFKRCVCLQDDVHRDKNLHEGLFNFEFLSHDSLHKNLAHDCHDISLSLPYSFEQSYFINHTYYDRIADWLERYFLAKFPENGKVAFTFFLKVKRVTLTCSSLVSKYFNSYY